MRKEGGGGGRRGEKGRRKGGIPKYFPLDTEDLGRSVTLLLSAMHSWKSAWFWKL